MWTNPSKSVAKCVRGDCKYFYFGKEDHPCSTCVCNNSRTGITGSFNYKMLDYEDLRKDRGKYGDHAQNPGKVQ